MARPILIPLCSAFLGGWLVLQFSTFRSVPTEPIPMVQANWSRPANVPTVASPNITLPARTSEIPVEGFRRAASDALDAVVHIRTVQTFANQRGWSGFFPSPEQKQIQRGSGSGVVLSPDGLIITNHHVIAGADAIEVGLNDNRSFEAELIGSDPSTDIAVLKIATDGLAALSWANSDDVHVGDWVLAVGNPFDLTSTVTAGIVSAKARSIQLLRPDLTKDVFPVESFIQTDAAVNPGNSGGALVNTEGRMVGINTAIASRTGSYSGYSFAVPSNLAAKVARDIIEFGEVQRAFLGVHIRPVDEILAENLGLPEVKGIMVTGLADGGGAIEAGLRKGDVILSIDGTATPSLPILLERVNQRRPGEACSIEVWREGETSRFTVYLKDRFEGSEVAGSLHENTFIDAYGGRISDDELGNGAKVLKAGQGALGRSGIQDGATIYSVDGIRIETAKGLVAAIEKANQAGKKAVLLEGKLPSGQTAWFGMGIP
ncbi:MAG: deoxyribonuclease HsdR [Crocinitomicaceae bacterium]|nr:deoxyribonuclease HsdR [Crocinitomicaceae bacterium]